VIAAAIWQGDGRRCHRSTGACRKITFDSRACTGPWRVIEATIVWALRFDALEISPFRVHHRLELRRFSGSQLGGPNMNSVASIA